MNTGSNKKEVEIVSTRVKNTKKEIEQLKSELEQLINLGVQPAFPLPKRSEQKSPEPPKLVRIVAKHPKPSQPIRKVNPKPPKNDAQSPTKKNRNYNIAETRDYIKKQREKRAEQLKTQINSTDAQLDIKKQKLRELHQKTIELVTKNVQLKRERSKSRDGVPPVRLDKATVRPKSQERLKPPLESQRTRSKSGEKQGLKVPPQRDVRSRSRDNQGGKVTPQKDVRSRSRDNQGGKVTPQKDVRSKSRDNQSVKTAPQKSPISGIGGNQGAEKSASQRTARSRTRNNEIQTVKHQKNEKKPVSALTEVEKIDKNLLHPPDVDLNKSVFVSNGVSDGFDLNKRLSEQPPQLLEHSIVTDACLKDSKETQTCRENNFGVAWMQPPALPYPYNFINTVKRKLQCAINSPRNYVDVGVQNSGGEVTPEVGRAKSREEIKELLIKSTSSDLKSFASHRNLDLKGVEGLELVSKEKSKEVLSKNLFTGYESDESDTSKNIPEISSESLGGGGDLKQKLNFQKLKDLKLKKGSEVKTESNGYADEEYSLDFHHERAGTKSKSTRSEDKSSSIKTLISDKKPGPEMVVPSDYSIDRTSTITNNSTSAKNSTSEPKIGTTNFIRGDGDSQKSFKSLLTESQSVPNTGTVSEVPTAKTKFFDSPSLSLKQPDVTLTFRKEEKLRNLSNSIINTITLGPANSSSSHQLEEKKENSSSNRGGSVFEKLESSSKLKDLSLKEPKLSLDFGRKKDFDQQQMRNITIRPANNVNEIHLKFEAEVRLLNDFNESFKQFAAVEKAFESLKNKQGTSVAMTKILQNVDTQTSVVTKTSTNVTATTQTTERSINFSRGSEIIQELNDSVVNSNGTNKSFQNSSFSTDWNLSNLNESSVTNLSIAEEEKSRFSVSNIENFNSKNCASLLSVNLFDQLIKDEDTRIQQLKAIIKIREQALLDRTKGELVWLEIQKKQLIETGKIEEASLLKKKQRGIILKHEQERNEIKKLKQMQKEASQKRKNTLKQQRNLIKNRLSTDNMLSTISVKKQRRERRSTGPLRVVQSCSESVQSETSISWKSEEVVSFSRVEEEDFEAEKGREVSCAKRELLMREAALQKRRKAAEELLRWHRKLLDEERKIQELEVAATSVVKKSKNRYEFNGKQLNQLWRNMTGSEGRKFGEDKVYVMSQVALERLCKSARQYKNKKSDSEERAKKASDVNYSSIFEPESVQEIIDSQEEKTKISSISELIDNFSRIEDEISTLSRRSSLSVVETMTPNRLEEGESQRLEEQETSVVDALEEEDTSQKSAIKEEASIHTVEEEIDKTSTHTSQTSPKDLEEKSPVDSTTIEEQQSSKDVLIEQIEKTPSVTTSESSPKALEKKSTITEELISPKEDLIEEQIEKTPSDTTSESSPKTLEKKSTITEELISPKEDPIEEQIEKTPSDLTSSKDLEEKSTITEEEQIASREDLVDEELGEKSPVINTEKEQTSSKEDPIEDQIEITPSAITPDSSPKGDLQEGINEKSEVVPSTIGKEQQSSMEDLDLEERTVGKSSSVATVDSEEQISPKKDVDATSNEILHLEEKTSEKSTTAVATTLEEKSSLTAGETGLEKTYEKSSIVTTIEEATKGKSSVETSLVTVEEEQNSSNEILDLEEQTISNSSSATVESLQKEIIQQSSPEDEDLEGSKSEDLDEKKSTKEETVKTSDSASKKCSEIRKIEDLSAVKECLDLDEALESASKIEESLSKLNEKLTSEKIEELPEDQSTAKDVDSIEEAPKSENSTSTSGEIEEKTPPKKNIDVKKRVFEILADASLSRGDKSPRLQDLYVTAYDVSASNSPEFPAETSFEEGRQLPTNIFGSEAEELWRKQLAIEQEIKQLELQQQKEQLPYLFVREIPNKPPPPYTPPSSLSSLPLSILPSDVKEITEIASYSSKVLYKAHQNNNLDKVKFSENGFKLFSKIEVSKICAEYVFNICRDIARDHYRQFKVVEEPSWLTLAKKSPLAKNRPPDVNGLERIFNNKLKELFGFKKARVNESAIIKWGRKKRDHVDEVLVIESQEEESQWTNFDKDELIVKNQVTVDIMKMLIDETASVFAGILKKKKLAS